MEEDKQQLNDIILNKGDSINNNKKIILAVATLGIILVIVVLLMNSISSSDSNNLPQAVLPPEPKEIQEETKSEPLFEEVEVVQENANNLDNIAQRLKEESKQEAVEPVKQSVAQKPVETSKPAIKEEPKKPQQSAPAVKTTGTKMYYAQVGSFSKYEPNKKFLKSITDSGFSYKYHKVGNLNKVLIGPFANEKEARSGLKVIKKKIEPGAFLVRY